MFFMWHIRVISLYGAPEFTQGFSGVSVAQSLYYIVLSTNVFLSVLFFFGHCIICASSIVKLSLLSLITFHLRSRY